MAGRGAVSWALFFSATALMALTLWSWKGRFTSQTRLTVGQRGDGGAAAKGPELFVAVMTAPKNSALRHAVRKHWAWPATVAYRFFLCDKPTQQVDLEEERSFTDILYVDCTEGYHRGLLTEKVITTMRVFLASFGEADWYFKTDDDTFPYLDLLLRFLRQQNKTTHTYAGRFYGKAAKPVRERDSKFFEPYEVFPEDTYPWSAAGGPGYVLDRGLVEFIMGTGIAAANVLWNEDKAVGVWVNKSLSAGVPVEYAELNGTDGYDDRNICYNAKRFRTGNYMIHNVTPRQMECLHTFGTVHQPGCECGWAVGRWAAFAAKRKAKR